MLSLEATNTANHSTVTSGGCAIETTVGDCVIVVSVHNEQNDDRREVLSVSGAGLTWARRKQLNFDSSTNIKQNLETWWAYAADPVENETITVTWDDEIDDATINILAVKGFDPSVAADPWDTSVTLPASQSDVTGSVVNPSLSLTTLADNTYAFVSWGTGVGGLLNTSEPPSGWDLIEHGFNGGGANYSQQDNHAKAYTAPQTATAVNVGGSPKEWGVILDALMELAPEVSSESETESEPATEHDLVADFADDGGLAAALSSVSHLTVSFADDSGLEIVATVLQEPLAPVTLAIAMT